jgi:hypothetical protein
VCREVIEASRRKRRGASESSPKAGAWRSAEQGIAYQELYALLCELGYHPRDVVEAIADAERSAGSQTVTSRSNWNRAAMEEGPSV